MLNRRTILMVLTSLFAAGSILWMQRKFEAGDERNALSLVQEYRPAKVTVPELLGAKYPGLPVAWSTATESACFQHVRVHAVVEEPGKPPEVFAFTVDINGPAIHPANENGRALLASLETSPALAAGTAAASAPVVLAAGPATALVAGPPSSLSAAPSSSVASSAPPSATSASEKRVTAPSEAKDVRAR